MSDGNTGVEGNTGNIDGNSGPVDPVAFAAAANSGGNAGTGEDGFEYDGNGNPVYNKDGSRRRKRGKRASGGGASSARSHSSQKTAADLKGAIDVLSGTLQLLHFTAANALNIPELVLKPEEGDSLAKATTNVMEQFDLRPDPKTQALIGAICVAGSIYGPRVYLYRTRLADEARARETGEALVINPDGTTGGTTNVKVN